MNLELPVGNIWEREFLERLALAFGSRKASPLWAILCAFPPEDARERQVRLTTLDHVQCIMTQLRDGRRHMYLNMRSNVHDESSRLLHMAFDESGRAVGTHSVSSPYLRAHWRRVAWLCGFPVDSTGHEQAKWMSWVRDELETFGDVWAFDIEEVAE